VHIYIIILTYSLYSVSFSKNREPLQDHMATLQEFLKEYQMLKSSELRVHYFEQFARYILASSWPKLSSRFKHSASLRCIEVLRSITPEELLSAITWLVGREIPSRTRDLPLCMEILSLTSVDVQFLVGLLREKGVQVDPGYNFNALIKVFRQLAEFDQMKDQMKQNTAQYPQVYTRATIIEFHHFVLAIYYAFDFALNYLRSPDPSSKDVDFEMCYKFAAIFWRMTHSSIFREHLTVLNRAQLLDDYIITTRVAGSAPAAAPEDPAAPEDSAAEADLKEGTDSEMQALTGGPTDRPTDKQDVSLIIMRVFRLHASHFTALDGLLSFFQDKPLTGKTVRIRLLAVRSLLPIEEEWEPILSRVSLNYRLSEIKDIICAEIKRYNTLPFPTIFNHFSNKDSKNLMRCSSAVHCESALAYLIINFDDAISKSNVDFDWFKVCFLLFFFFGNLKFTAARPLYRTRSEQTLLPFLLEILA
jgi:hypothetical protein